MRKRTQPAWTASLALPLAWLLAGCGGGGAAPSAAGPTRTANVTVTVNWPARSRFVNPPASALSAVIRLEDANPAGGDLSFSIDRNPDPSAYTQTVVSPAPAKVGTWVVRAEFYAEPGGSGSLVGSAAALATLNPDGSGIDYLTTVGKVATVAVVPNQSLLVGETKDLVFSAHDAQGGLIALSPGAAFFQVASGMDRLQVSASGTATGLLPGPAGVRATVDGIISPATPVAVTSNAAVTITPPAPAISILATQQFSASVTGAPDASVTWGVRESGGGTITPAGLYTAPSVPGVYHIYAVSQYDPAKQATVAVTVQSGNVGVGIQ